MKRSVLLLLLDSLYASLVWCRLCLLCQACMMCYVTKATLIYFIPCIIIKKLKNCRTSLTNHTGSISYHIMPLISNALGHKHTDIQTHAYWLQTKAISRNLKSDLRLDTNVKSHYIILVLYTFRMCDWICKNGFYTFNYKYIFEIFNLLYLKNAQNSLYAFLC